MGFHQEILVTRIPEISRLSGRSLTTVISTVEGRSRLLQPVPVGSNNGASKPTRWGTYTGRGFFL